MPLTSHKEDFPLLCERLEQAKLHGRVGQAYLLTGDSSAYLESFALGVAQTFSCQTPTATGAACHSCRACQLFEMNDYPELRILRPQSKSRQISIDAVREFEHWVHLSPMAGLTKIGIIADAECMGTEAQNAFLKTLEEPPERVILLLYTVNARMLLPTIRSRCQSLSLLRNRIDYTLAMDADLFSILEPLRRNAGAIIGLQKSHQLFTLFSSLHKSAEAMKDELKDSRWTGVKMEDIDPATRKQLDDELKARIEAEYIRRRDVILQAILAWFHQRLLIATGVQKDLLPHAEFLPFSQTLLEKPPTPDEATQDIHEAETLVKCIRNHIEEHLALDAFCLAVTEK